MKVDKLQIKAFTLLESLVVLAISTSLILTTNNSISKVLKEIETTLFFMEFEKVYRETQQLSISQQKKTSLSINEKSFSNTIGKYTIPSYIKPEKSLTIDFNEFGGNSSLAKIRFQTPNKTVSYQLYLGSGQYKKKTN